MYCLRIRSNDREKDAAWMAAVRNPGSTCWRTHPSFMAKFVPGKYLSWEAVDNTENYGPGPSHHWVTTEYPCDYYDSVEEALAMWEDRPVDSVGVEVVEVTLTVVKGV